MLDELVTVIGWMQHRDGSRLKQAEEYVHNVSGDYHSSGIWDSVKLGWG